MYKKVFISHSKDDPHLDFFHKVFSGIATESIWMELENLTSPPYACIREKLNQCDAVFVLLSKHILSKPHTANWVSFEIGLAANRQVSTMLTRKKGLDVYVFEPLSERIDFAVPYCTYYMPYYDRGIDEIQYIKELIRDAPLHRKGFKVQCPHYDCRLEFKLLTNVEVLACPSCRKDFTIMPEEIEI